MFTTASRNTPLSNPTGRRGIACTKLKICTTICTPAPIRDSDCIISGEKHGQTVNGLGKAKKHLIYCLSEGASLTLLQAKLSGSQVWPQRVGMIQAQQFVMRQRSRQRKQSNQY